MTTHAVSLRSPAIAIDLGSRCARIWAVGCGILTEPATSWSSATYPVHRGRITSRVAGTDLLGRLFGRYRLPKPQNPVVVACSPVLASAADEDLLHQVATDVFAPARVIRIESVRAAAIGAGSAPGPLVVADIGAHLVEVAALRDGVVLAARRANIGTHDLSRSLPLKAVAGTVARLLAELRDEVPGPMESALRRGLLVVGDGAMRPELIARLNAQLPAPAQSAGAARTAALHGAGIAAMAANRHPGLDGS